MRARKSTKHKVILPVLFIVGLVVLLAWYLSNHTIAVLEPAGTVGDKEKHLMIIGLLLSVIVVVPVYIMTVLIVLIYREDNHKNKKVKYRPDWDRSRLFETVWWGIPLVIISILSVITWNSSHALDPFRPLASSTPTINVQVVALDWKWLFIYPDQHVASVQYLELPENTPVDFNITSDTVMNSFWIPQLGGQIYAMPGMMTQLNLMANRPGSFDGWSANISGQGFADMNFTANSVSRASYNNWLKTLSQSDNHLNMSTYGQLAQHSFGYPITYFSNVSPNLFSDIILKYMAPNINTNSSSSGDSQDMIMGSNQGQGAESQ